MLRRGKRRGRRSSGGEVASLSDESEILWDVQRAVSLQCRRKVWAENTDTCDQAGPGAAAVARGSASAAVSHHWDPRRGREVRGWLVWRCCSQLCVTVVSSSSQSRDLGQFRVGYVKSSHS